MQNALDACGTSSSLGRTKMHLPRTALSTTPTQAAEGAEFHEVNKAAPLAK